MYIIVGLGNPGKEYENTKHNIGFITVDYFAEKHNIDVKKLKFKALIGEARFGGEKIILVKPQTYMNLSGESVFQILDYYKEDTANLIVIYDDIDIPMGSIRIRKKGSAGTHNGMRSVIGCLGKDDFSRIRIGIGAGQLYEPIMGNSDSPLATYVTSGFMKEDVPLMEEAVINACSAIERIITDGLDASMQEYNRIIKNEESD